MALRDIPLPDPTAGNAHTAALDTALRHIDARGVRNIAFNGQSTTQWMGGPAALWFLASHGGEAQISNTLTGGTWTGRPRVTGKSILTADASVSTV